MPLSAKKVAGTSFLCVARSCVSVRGIVSSNVETARSETSKQNWRRNRHIRYQSL
ncbi:unnamed protein product [Chondrus crispus]|uniref:Uncharacterized protein n=1 Tax=Chondrus crispus TaxID=2769 RepID=R7QK94_CHOCR|nr:unnamed protein product [Chondrus crispus]CDF38474.1 unnamed protein product [Chondrus crispus]|eukprot:XP_005718367.1 unnamed protein product [Chondrus crispus]